MLFLPPSSASYNLTATTDKEEDSERKASTSPDTMQSNADWAVEEEHTHAKWKAVLGTSGEIDRHEKMGLGIDGERRGGLSTDSRCKGNLQSDGCLGV